MKIITFFIAFLLIYGICYASTSYDANNGAKNCSEYPNINNTDGYKYIPVSNSFSSPPSGSFSCEKYWYYSGEWSSWKAKNSHYSCPNKGYAGEIQRSGNNYRIFCKTLNITVPSNLNIQSIPQDNANLLATNNQEFIIKINNTNVIPPISFIKGIFEASNTTDSYGSEFTINGTNNFQKIFDISNVDNSRESGGFRKYSYKIIKVCNAAGNCLTPSGGVKTFNYNVYSNTLLSSVGNRNIIYNELVSDLNIADGTTKNLKVELKDIYGNVIIPAPAINREISFEFDIDNFLYLNQYNRSSGSAVFGETNVFLIGDNVFNNFNNMSSSDGNYDFSFKFYAPTYQNYKADINAKFNINNISANISSNLTNPIGVNSIIPLNHSFPIESNFKPLYTTSINGGIKDNGFIEGTIQNSSIDIRKNGTRNTTGGGVYIEFGSGPRLQSEKYDLFYSQNSIPNLTVSEKPSYVTNSILFNPLNLGPRSIKTKLLQQSVVKTKENNYFSTHIKYNLDSKEIVYNSDIIGKNNYWDDNSGDSSTQIGVKIIGLTSSQKFSEITENQSGVDVVLLGKISKPELRESIRKKAWGLIKNITPDNGLKKVTNLEGLSWNNSHGKKLFDDKILYFGSLSGSNVELGFGNEIVGGKKTLIIEGGNLYIKSNMSYNSNSDILGIIVLKDSSQNGGNVYIDPSVNKIVGTIFADKSIISYDGNELDGNTDVSVLKNQLHIFGSLFSENTIGGSRKNPLECPYYVSLCNDLVFAQKYDLNFLRRYFLVDDGAGNLIPANLGISSFPSSSNYYKYPIVIEYNPLIQISPPVIFGR